jgi:hypothetical protein
MTKEFDFLRAEWRPNVYEAAAKAADAAYPDLHTACFYPQRALELAVPWAFKSDASLRLPYQDNLSTAFRNYDDVFSITRPAVAPPARAGSAAWSNPHA